MPINVFVISSSNDNDNKNDTSLFVQKPHLRSKYIEVNIKKIMTWKNNTDFKIFKLLLVLRTSSFENSCCWLV